MRRMRGWVAVVAAALALSLTACAGLPMSGAVEEGRTPGSDDAPPDILFIPDRPQQGATPVQIVDGFLRAGSGPTDNWARAREFLAPGFQSEWVPTAGVTIDVLGTRVTRELEDDSVSVLVSQVATVDQMGTYERAVDGTTPLAFELAEQADGEWRITNAPDGIVLDRSIFTDVFDPYPLAYFDTSWQFLVPDVRWFPASRAASSIAVALINGPPSEWLAASVFSAFPQEVSAGVSVPVSAGSADVSLSDEALNVDAQSRDRMLTQLQASLAAAGVNDVEMLVGNTVLEADPVLTRRTTVTGAPLVAMEDDFGFLSGDEIVPIPGLSPAIAELDAAAVQVGADHETAAVQLRDGSVDRVRADGTVLAVDERRRLVDPTIDPNGIIWTVPQDAPQAVRAQLPDGQSIEVADAWREASHIDAMAVSRDGARVAAIVTVGGRTSVSVAGVLRGSDGEPVSLGQPVALGTVASAGRGLAWLDDTTIGVLSGEDDSSRVLTQLVGGPGVDMAGPTGAVSIAEATSAASMRLRGADGTLYIRRAANWQESASGVRVLATQQGIPQ